MDDLKNTMIELIVALSDIFTLPSERGDLGAAEFYYKRLHRDTIMQRTIHKLLPHKEKVKNCDIAFFTDPDNDYIFKGLPADRVTYYKDLIVGGVRVTKDDLDCIWAYLDTMIACAESYKKQH